MMEAIYITDSNNISNNNDFMDKIEAYMIDGSKDNLTQLLDGLFKCDIITLGKEANSNNNGNRKWNYIYFVKDGKKSVPIFTDMMSVDKFLEPRNVNVELKKLIAPFYTVFKEIETIDDFEGIYLNPKSAGLFIPTSILHVIGLIYQANKEKNSISSEKQITINSGQIIKMKGDMNYNELKIKNDEQAVALVNEAIDSYAPNVKVEDVLAIDEFRKKGLFSKKAGGIIFAKQYVCCSSFPENYRILYYNEINKVAQHIKSVYIKLYNGDEIEADLGERGDVIQKMLNSII